MNFHMDGLFIPKRILNTCTLRYHHFSPETPPRCQDVGALRNCSLLSQPEGTMSPADEGCTHILGAIHVPVPAASTLRNEGEPVLAAGTLRNEGESTRWEQAGKSKQK